MRNGGGEYKEDMEKEGTRERSRGGVEEAEEIGRASCRERV